MGCLEATIKRETVEFKYCLFSEGWRNASESLRFFYAEKHSVARGEGEFRSGKKVRMKRNIPWRRKSKKDKKAECLRKEAELSAPNEYNPNLKPILVGGAFGLFLFYKLI